MFHCDDTGALPAKPIDFESWLKDLELIVDSEGSDLFWLGWLYAPSQCCEYLQALPGVVQALIARARWTDRCAGYTDLRRRVS